MESGHYLFQINGERLPDEVYKDFRAAIFKILGTQDNPPVFSSGKVAPLPDNVTTIELPAVVNIFVVRLLFFNVTFLQYLSIFFKFLTFTSTVECK